SSHFSSAATGAFCVSRKSWRAARNCICGGTWRTISGNKRGPAWSPKSTRTPAVFCTLSTFSSHAATSGTLTFPLRTRPRRRRRGFAEEVVVCEDLSKGGISFRSRNQYPEGSRVEVAVPFTPGTGAIFVPIRIVFSQAIPTAGLHRHGAAYIKPPIDN